MKPEDVSPIGALQPSWTYLLDRMFAGLELPDAVLLDALQLARTAAGSSTMGSTATADALLAELHLDLASAEIAEAFGAARTDDVDDQSAVQQQAADLSSGRLLVERCARVVQEWLDRGSGTPPELLACTRAVIHLDAARRAWPEADQPGRTHD